MESLKDCLSASSNHKDDDVVEVEVYSESKEDFFIQERSIVIGALLIKGVGTIERELKLDR